MMQVGKVSDVSRDDAGEITPGEIKGCDLACFLVTFDAGPSAPYGGFRPGECR